jgi:cytochrome P450
MDHASTHLDPAERSPDMISKRLAVLSFAAIQSSATTLTNLILDLAASPLCPTYLSSIREEVCVELAAEHGAWTKAGLAHMTRLDSALRESMRLWGFVSRGVLKVVVKKEGVRLPGGLHLPFGTKVGVHAHPIHHDEDVYVGAYKFDALRWCNEENGGVEGSDFEKGLKVSEKQKGTPLVTTSSNFMAFSHGRHAWYVFPLFSSN